MRLFLTNSLRNRRSFHMKRTPKAAFFIVAVLILLLCVTSIFGVYTRFGDRTDTVIRGIFDIRWGVDIQGGVEARFGPADGDVLSVCRAGRCGEIAGSIRTKAADWCANRLFFCLFDGECAIFH